ncbi:MAG: YlxR family protein [Oscillospiraceae bacterium]|jgi:predicted RNA-binding protein YlxR (DUF448 family)|nr:YlxR family protein [Oscillospiraceae bacterium]
MKSEPVRQCAGCREHLPKRELLRVIRTPEGTVAFDPTGKAQGRGVYLCRKSGCLKRIRKSRALERALKAPVPEAVFASLERELEGSADEP